MKRKKIEIWMLTHWEEIDPMKLEPNQYYLKISEVDYTEDELCKECGLPIILPSQQVSHSHLRSTINE